MELIGDDTWVDENLSERVCHGERTALWILMGSSRTAPASKSTFHHCRVWISLRTRVSRKPLH